MTDDTYAQRRARYLAARENTARIVQGRPALTPDETEDLIRDLQVLIHHQRAAS